MSKRGTGIAEYSRIDGYYAGVSNYIVSIDFLSPLPLLLGTHTNRDLYANYITSLPMGVFDPLTSLVQL